MDVNTHEIEKLIQQGESLTLEFKSDQKPLPDRDLVAVVVALANAEGGELLLGVEDDGKITGLHDKHRNLTGLKALIANRTNPSIAVRAERLEVRGQAIGHIVVPRSYQLVATSDGLLLQRRIKSDGTPEAVPFYPYEFGQRLSSLGMLDPSAIVLEELSSQQLDPLQRVRLRNAIKNYGGDKSLLALGEDEFDGALGLCREVEGSRHPTVSGLLMLGTEELLRQHLPAHEVAFQVLQGTRVKVNEFYHKPLLETFNKIEVLFNAFVQEEELQVGLFRVPVPNYDRSAFREGLVNALVHRDYSALGTARVQINDNGLTISNPGGFVDGVTLANLLVVDPRSRNPLLADITKRIGLAERTGRGIDRIYEGMLRYGRPAPDYSASDNFTVSLQMVNAAADPDFFRMVVEQEDKLGLMPVDSLIILSRLREEKRLTMADLLPSVQKSETVVRATLEKLVEAGFLEPRGTSRGRSYILSAALYRRVGEKAEYVRQAGFIDIQQEQMVLNYINTHGSIKRADVVELCRITPKQAYKLLLRLKGSGAIIRRGERRGAIYMRKP